jgi:cytochrome c oxidase cbb3-type subunit 1
VDLWPLDHGAHESRALRLDRLPLVGFLFKVYGADRGPLRNGAGLFSGYGLRLWRGALSWLSGYSSGKLFLDWSGYARVLFPALLLSHFGYCCCLPSSSDRSARRGAATASGLCGEVLGLAILLAVPFLIYAAAGPNNYPPVNPETGGPTGTSQLESSSPSSPFCSCFPSGLRDARPAIQIIAAGWVVLVAESLLCAALSRADISHHIPSQYLSLGSLLVWLPLTPTYYAAFEWHSNTRRWRLAFLWWWAALVVTGWVFFLPGVLDHFKFTDGLVGHSFVAMAGFTSSLIIFVMVQLLGDGGWIFNRARSFHLWNGSVIAYIVVVTIAGWREGFDPTFTIVPGIARNVLYALRLVTGILMLIASHRLASRCIHFAARTRPFFRQPEQVAQEKTA